jgi:hypothetical protein
MFLYVSALFTILAFIKDYKQTKKLSLFNISFFIAFVVFLIFGTWDAINKYLDVQGSQTTIYYYNSKNE